MFFFPWNHFHEFFREIDFTENLLFFSQIFQKKVLPKVVSNIFAIWDFKVDFYTDRPTPVICILGSILNQNIYPHENVSILLFLQQHFAKKKQFFLWFMCVFPRWILCFDLEILASKSVWCCHQRKLEKFSSSMAFEKKPDYMRMERRQLLNLLFLNSTYIVHKYTHNFSWRQIKNFSEI